MNVRIGKATIYTQVVRYVETGLVEYRVRTPFGEKEVEVSGHFINTYGEKLAVPMTAWGELREAFPKLSELSATRRQEMRAKFIEACTFTRV